MAQDSQLPIEEVVASGKSMLYIILGSNPPFYECRQTVRRILCRICGSNEKWSPETLIPLQYLIHKIILVSRKVS